MFNPLNIEEMLICADKINICADIYILAQLVDWAIKHILVCIINLIVWRSC